MRGASARVKTKVGCGSHLRFEMSSRHPWLWHPAELIPPPVIGLLAHAKVLDKLGDRLAVSSSASPECAATGRDCQVRKECFIA